MTHTRARTQRDKIRITSPEPYHKMKNQFPLAYSLSCISLLHMNISFVTLIVIYQSLLMFSSEAAFTLYVEKTAEQCVF
jgi:hypothetical protein